MPELISIEAITQRHLNSGDVIQVTRKMEDKNGKKYDWKFFAVVVEDGLSDIECIPFGAVNEKREDSIMTLYLYDDRNTVYYLAPEEWPDGVHANRLRMILTGLITII